MIQTQGFPFPSVSEENPPCYFTPEDQWHTRNSVLPAVTAWRGSFHQAPRESQEIVQGFTLSPSNCNAFPLLLLLLLQTAPAQTRNKSW